MNYWLITLWIVKSQARSCNIFATLASAHQRARALRERHRRHQTHVHRSQVFHCLSVTGVRGDKGMGSALAGLRGEGTWLYTGQGLSGKPTPLRGEWST